MIYLKQATTNYLLIYGGRNDNIYSMTKNVALNDICLFNLNTFTWEALAMFGQMPSSRWNHAMAARASDHSAGEGVIVLGGISMQGYCKSKLFSF